MVLFAVMYGSCIVNSAADAAIDGALLVLQPSGANAFVTSGLSYCVRAYGPLSTRQEKGSPRVHGSIYVPGCSCCPLNVAPTSFRANIFKAGLSCSIRRMSGFCQTPKIAPTHLHLASASGDGQTTRLNAQIGFIVIPCLAADHVACPALPSETGSRFLGLLGPRQALQPSGRLVSLELGLAHKRLPSTAYAPI